MTKQRTVKSDDGTYTTECECGWVSSGWTRRRDADERRGQHETEHDTSEPMPELVAFRAGKD